MDQRLQLQDVVFDVDVDAYDPSKADKFVSGTKSSEFLVLDETVTKICHHFKKMKMPDAFFQHLDTSLIDQQVITSIGTYANKELIKSYIDKALKQNKNRHVVSVINSEGALGAVQSGALSVGQLKSAKVYQEEVAKEDEKAKNEEKELSKGETWSFECFKTGRVHTIESHKESGAGTAGSAEYKRTETGAMTLVKVNTEHVKRKHYFFYSPAGYGKTVALEEFSKVCNATAANDPNNFSGCREDAQFLIIDEYGPDKRMLMSQLKSLTSGSPKSSFAGNRKSYGASFVPRNDVQVIILSNHHLFYCMGRGREHKISPVDADALRDRFHIIKMDTGVRGAGTEEDDAKRYVEPLYDGSEWSPASLAPKPVLTREQIVEDLNTFGASDSNPISTTRSRRTCKIFSTCRPEESLRTFICP